MEEGEGVIVCYYNSCIVIHIDFELVLDNAIIVTLSGFSVATVSDMVIT